MDASETEQEDFLKISADINSAYQTFTNPDASLSYFLTEKGIITKDEKYQLPPDFLMKMMELNELLDEGKKAESSTAIHTTIKIMEAETDLHKFTTAEDFTPAALADLKSFYYKKKYLLRILDRLGD